MRKVFNGLDLLTYEGYLNTFEEMVSGQETSSANPTEALVEFTRLNLARTQRIHKTISINSALQILVEGLQHHYTWVVITEAWCGDSAQNLPIIAELAKLNPTKIKLQILWRDKNLQLMDQYLTNGARAIPKLIALDDTLGTEAFVWGPRPASPQELLLAWKQHPEGRSWEDFEKELHSWYAKDKGESIQQEFIQLLALQSLSTQS